MFPFQGIEQLGATLVIKCKPGLEDIFHFGVQLGKNALTAAVMPDSASQIHLASST